MSEYFYARITKLRAESQNIQDMSILTMLKNRKAVEEIGKPLKKIFSDFSEIGKPLKKIEF